ncbi:WS/DGAT domain-containing protein [Gordonia amicalis]|uniref:WS/DGAT domain-containing protein n=1 Tax=Gordonia amicalis TaxID=89053 RepID=A0ABU4DFB8_9ACTN|nr:WS/DGAT domain-containing protein [Gordonia amicalis]MDV6308439.1 WS/DGAT domain-containing protein [Gordonia amicalis]MDV7100856.1 WS/DGAT domain-containing protein [Gordonia amicalis]
MQRMAAADAASYWMSERIANDQFLLYGFATPAISLDECARRLLARARHVDDLCLRIHDVPASADRPYWVSAEPTPDQVRVDTTTRTWSSCLDIVGALVADQLVPSRAAWRLHLFGPVAHLPAGDGPPVTGVVVVLQISHALGDGRRASQIARDLFDAPYLESVGGGGGVPGLIRDVGTLALGALRFPAEFVSTIRRGMQVAHVGGQANPGKPGYPLTTLNRNPGSRRLLRVVVLDRERLTASGSPVTVAVLVAISQALPRYLGDGCERLGVELTVGRSDKSKTRNNFRNVGIDLHLEADEPHERARLIRDEIDAARAADADPARVAQRRVSEATPAILAHWGIWAFDLDTRPETVTGVTVVSSVDRGAADVDLDGGEILFTTGFPALSPVQGLTHGVHGIGDRVAVSVTTSPEIMPDVDRYMDLLRAGFDAPRR